MAAAEPFGWRICIMMTADECRAHADALIRYADECPDIDLVIELETTAAEWRKLAAFDDAQTTLRAALAALSDEPIPSLGQDVAPDACGGGVRRPCGKT
jgi:hypothetical protein